MDPNVVKKTQDTLGKVIKKPPLTEKLLNKPPFRFLHDVVTEVIKTNGFFKGLYQNEEMKSANVKEKEAKITFLQKAIDCVVLVTGESLSVRPSKVVAGHEPEKTNEFLQLLGKACLKKLDSKDGVKKVLAGEKPGSGSASKRRESKTVKEKPNEKENINKEVENNKDTINEDDVNARRKASSSRISSSDTRKRRDSSDHRRKENEAEESTKERIKEKEKDKDRSKEKNRNKKEESQKEESKNQESDESSRNSKVQNDETDVVDGDEDLQNRNMPRPSSAKGQRRRPKNDDEDDNEVNELAERGSSHNEINGIIDSEELPQMPARRKLARPSSARPAPPRKRRQQNEADETAARIGSTTQVSNVIVDNSKDDEEDDTFLVEEAPPANIEVAHADESEAVENGAEGEHGALVKKMLETKKELEATSKNKAEPSTKPLMNDAHQRKQREHAQKEIEKLRESIQTLCRSANPLGKIMDYIQEDMDSMQKELEMWREENKQHQLALKREQSVTESEIEPLKSHLADMETDVNEMLERISTVKCNILRNEEKIQNLLAGVLLS